jgi:hypothetical protein
MPLLCLLDAMHIGLALGWWPILGPGLPAAGFVMRVFALQHDCGHGSLFRSRRVNDAVGRFCSLFTMTSYRIGGGSTPDTTPSGTTSTGATAAPTSTRPVRPSRNTAP